MHAESVDARTYLHSSGTLEWAGNRLGRYNQIKKIPLKHGVLIHFKSLSLPPTLNLNRRINVMTSLFDKDCNLVGWLKDYDHIFDINMVWVAYVKNGHVWSVKTGGWCGPINNNNCLDRDGKVVAWHPGESIRGSEKPVTPVKPVRPVKPVIPVRPVSPVRPVRPVTPIGGWSPVSFSNWVNQ